MFSRILSVKEFTGYHMLAVMGLFFGTIIAVNLTLAYYAQHTWTGLVVKNSYIASQEFDARTAERKAQASLGWKPVFSHENGKVVLLLTGRDGGPVNVEKMMVKIGHPAEENNDQLIELVASTAGKFTADAVLTKGIWQADLEASQDGKVLWNKSYRFVAR